MILRGGPLDGATIVDQGKNSTVVTFAIKEEPYSEDVGTTVWVLANPGDIETELVQYDNQGSFIKMINLRR